MHGLTVDHRIRQRPSDRLGSGNYLYVRMVCYTHHRVGTTYGVLEAVWTIPGTEYIMLVVSCLPLFKELGAAIILIIPI